MNEWMDEMLESVVKGFVVVVVIDVVALKLIFDFITFSLSHHHFISLSEFKLNPITGPLGSLRLFHTHERSEQQIFSSRL